MTESQNGNFAGKAAFVSMGRVLRNPATVQVIRHDGDLYIRVVNGRIATRFGRVQDIYKAWRRTT